MKAFIKTTANGYTFLHFYNSTEVYSMQGFDTQRKARNYAKRHNVELTEVWPVGIQRFNNDN